MGSSSWSRGLSRCRRGDRPVGLSGGSTFPGGVAWASSHVRRRPMSDVTRAQAYMHQLVAELEARGLQVAAKLPTLTVRNPAVSGEDPQGRAMSPGLAQGVLIRNDEGH